MIDTTVQLHTSLGDPAARFAVNSPQELNTTTRGESVTFTLEFFQESLVVESGETYTIPSGETEYYTDVVVDGTLNVDGTLFTYTRSINDGGTVNNTGEVNITGGSLGEVLGFDEYAGKYTIGESFKATQYYTENTPESAPALVIGFEPSTDLQAQDIPGVWTLVDNVEDARPQALSTNRVSITATVLAEYSEYTTLSDVQAALERLR